MAGAFFIMGMLSGKMGTIGYMEWFKDMAYGYDRLANFEVDARSRKKSGSAASVKRASASSAAGKSSAGGTKSSGAASKQHMKSQTNTKKKKFSIEENPLSRRNSQVYYVEEAPRRQRREDYDAYDRIDQSVRKPRKNSKKKRRRKKKSAFSGVSFLLLLMIVGFAGLCVWRVQEYEALAEMKAVVSRQTFYSGTTVEGLDVSGMTLQQALDHWNTQIEPAYRETTVMLNDGTRITAEQMGYSSDYADVLTGAWSAGRSGSLVERYERMTRHMAQASAHEVTRTLYNDKRVREYASAIAQQVNTAPVDAKLKSFNTQTQAFEFEPDKPGYTLNQEALVSGIESALNAGGGSVNLQVDTVAPAVTQENVASQYGMITSAVTNASASSYNRISNIRLALSSLDGFYLDPGQSFSFNEVVGKRTAERGYKKATAYSGGKVTEELGGGICQVSTTLFNAAVKADLQIDERHPHSLTVSYVDLGKDAAVDWGNKDLRFTNTSDERIYFCCYLSEDNRVRIGVFGRLLPDGTSITLEGVKTGTRDFETEYQLNFMMASGQTRVVQEGKQGYYATAYKVWWDANGNEIKRSEFCKSSYKSTPEIIEYGP